MYSGPAVLFLRRVIVMTLATALAASSTGAGEPGRFLLVYSQHSVLAANIAATAGVKSVLDDALKADYEVFAEFRDGQRFPGAEEDRLFEQRLQRRYAGRHIDGVLVFGEYALRTMIADRELIAPGVPIVFGGIGPERLSLIPLPEGVQGVRSDFSVAGTVALAHALQPQARRIVLMAGSAAFDRSWEPLVRAQLASEALPVEFLSGLTLDGFTQAAAAMDTDTILVVLTIFEDAAGRPFTPANATALIAAGSGTPVWGVYDTFIGRGGIGGSVVAFDEIGRVMGELALAIADGEGPREATIPAPTHLVVDWRVLQRFGLDPASLPPGTERRFYDPSAWERYRPQILLALGIILAQSATILALAVQGRRKRRAEREVAARRVELAHVSRVAQLGELSGAVAHELNQPLTAILANAEAGGRLLARPAPDLAEIAEILAEIADDDRRAARIILDLRRMMTKGEADFETLDLNEVAAATIRLSRSEMLVREVALEFRPARERLAIAANRVQVKQVLLNLLLNAADAMAEAQPEERAIVVATERRADGWCEVAVQDWGPGLAAEVAADPFKPFVTTKASGLGLGLSICRSIAQAHGGTLAFDAAAEQGARVVLALPPAPRGAP